MTTLKDCSKNGCILKLNLYIVCSMRELTLTDLFTFASHGGGTTAETMFGRPANGVHEGHGRVCWSRTVTRRKLCCTE